MHPACADDDVGAVGGGEACEDQGREVGVVVLAGEGRVFRVGLFVGDEVVVGCWDGGDGGGGAREAVGGFAAGGDVSWECSIIKCLSAGGWECAYFEITCEMRAFCSLPDAQASMRACRLDPLPEIRTTRL